MLLMNGICRGESMLKSTYKVAGGKMVKIKLDVQDNKISRIVIMGDFFMHPEDALPELEKYLVSTEVSTVSLTRRIATFLEKNNVLVVGVTPGDFAEAIMLAVGFSQK